MSWLIMLVILVPENSDVELACYEFFRIGDWAVRNVMIINITKTKELVFMQKSQGGPCLFH